MDSFARAHVLMGGSFLSTWLGRCSFPIEARMRVELTNLGLMENPDMEYDQVSHPPSFQRNRCISPFVGVWPPTGLQTPVLEEDAFS